MKAVIQKVGELSLLAPRMEEVEIFIEQTLGVQIHLQVSEAL
jgi:hypothetical protein